MSNQRLIGYVLVLLGATGFSAKGILIKLAYSADLKLDAITLMALRMLFSLPFYLVIALWQSKTIKSEPFTLKQSLAVIILGLIGYYFASFLDFLGLQLISAGLERLIIFTYPSFVVLLSALLYRKKISGWVLLALLSSYIGIALVFIEQVSFASNNIFLGSAFVLASSVVFSFFVVGSGEMVQRIGSARFTAWSMTVACLATLLHFTIQHNTLEMLNSISQDVYVLGLLMAVFSTVLPSFLMNTGIKQIGASNAAILSSVGPIVTLILAEQFLNEPITSVQVLGTLFVLAGGFIVTQRKS